MKVPHRNVHGSTELSSFGIGVLPHDRGDLSGSDRIPGGPFAEAVRARGHFPNDAAALKCLYLVTRSLDPTGRGRARWATRWKPALNAFAIAFEGRIN